MPIHKDTIRKARIIISFTQTSYTEPSADVQPQEIKLIARDLYSGLTTGVTDIILGNLTNDLITENSLELVFPWQGTGVNFPTRTAVNYRDNVLFNFNRVTTDLTGTASLGTFEATTTDGFPSITWTQTTATVLSETHPTHSSGINVSVLNAVTATEDNYTVEGVVNATDWLGTISAGNSPDITQTQAEITFTSIPQTVTGQNFNRIQFSAPSDLGVVSLFARLENRAGTFLYCDDGSVIPSGAEGNEGPLAGRPICNTANTIVCVLGGPSRTTEAFVEDLALAWNFVYGRRSVSTTFTASGSTVRFSPDDRTVDYETPVFTFTPATGNLFDGIFTTNTVDVEFPGPDMSLTFADDPNRSELGNRLGVRISGTAVRNATTGEDLPSINFAKGATFNIDNGFIFNVSEGYTWNGDAGDLTININDGAQLTFDTEDRENLWGGTFRFINGSIAPSPDSREPFNASVAHPVNINRNNGGQINQATTTNQHVIPALRRTFLIGEVNAQDPSTAIPSENTGRGRLIFNNNESATQIYSVGSSATFIYPVPGININPKITVDSDGTGRTVYPLIDTIKQFSGISFVHNRGRFELSNSGRISQTDGINFDYDNALWIGNNFNFNGELATSTIPLINPQNLQNILISPAVNGDFTTLPTIRYNSRPVAGLVGAPTLGVLWDPSWEYKGSSKAGIYESYIYGDRTSISNSSTSVKGLSANDINTFSANVKPYNLAYLSTTEGLRQVGTLTDNSYLAGTGWGDTDTPSNGLFLAYTKGFVPTTALVGEELLFAPQQTNWTSYTRSDGFRPYFTTLPFARNYRGAPSATQLDGLIDVHWQDTFETESIATLEGYATVVYASGTNTFTVNVGTTCDTWSKLYRGVEHRFNTNDITGDAVTDDTTANAMIPGFWRRLFNREAPVNSDGEASSTEFAMTVFFQQGHRIVPGTGGNAVEGVSLADTFLLTMAHTSLGDLPIVEGRISFDTSAALDVVNYRNATITGKSTFTLANVSDSTLLPSRDLTIRGTPVNTIVNFAPSGSVTQTLTLVSGCNDLVVTGDTFTNITVQPDATDNLDTGIWGSTESRLGAVLAQEDMINIELVANSLSAQTITRCTIDTQNNFSSGNIADSVIDGGSFGIIGSITGTDSVVNGANIISSVGSLSDGELNITGNVNFMGDVNSGTFTCGGNVTDIRSVFGGTVLCTGNLGSLESSTGGTIRCDGNIVIRGTPAGSSEYVTTNTVFSQRTPNMDGTFDRADVLIDIGTSNATHNVAGSSGINFIRGPRSGTWTVNVPVGTQLPTKDPDNGTNFTDNIIINRAFNHTIIVPGGADPADTDPRVRVVIVDTEAPHAVLFNSTTPGATFNIGDTQGHVTGVRYTVLAGRKGSEPTQITFTAGELETPDSFTPSFVDNPYPTNETIAAGVAVPQTYAIGTPADLIVQTTTALKFSSAFLNQLFQEQVVQDTNFLFWFFDHPNVSITVRSQGRQSFMSVHESFRIRVGATGLVLADKTSTGYVRTVDDNGVTVANTVLTTGWFNPCIAPDPLNFDLIVNRAEIAGELNDRRVTRQNMNLLGILAPINDVDPT